MALFLVLLIIAGGILGGGNGVLIAFAVGIGLNFFAYWFSDKIVLRMHKASELTPSEAPGLIAMVQNLSSRANIPMPRVYLINSDSLNAFATGRNPANGVVAFTSGIVNRLDRRQLAGVIAHELAHIRNRDILISSIAAALAGAIMVLARFALFFGGGRNNLIASLAMMILGPIAAMLIQAAISRTREFVADEDGARICGDPMSLASALAALETTASHSRHRYSRESTAHMYIISPFAGGGSGIRRLFSTHPPTQERIRRLQELHHR